MRVVIATLMTLILAQPLGGAGGESSPPVAASTTSTPGGEVRTEAPLESFVPSEQVRPGAAISFPVDI